ncbi:uncharacterized protein V6R79_026454 [Siganus canaliculatus]
MEPKQTQATSKLLKIGIIFLLMNICQVAVPVSGFALRNCRIVKDNAICSNLGPKLHAVPKDIPPTVRGLDLTKNRIYKIHVSDFKNVPLLKWLDLKVNNISTIEPHAFARLAFLEILNLNNNRLDKLEKDVFSGLSNLKKLNISNNRIKTVDANTFKPLTHLTFLGISNNKLQYMTNVHMIIQHLPNLQELIIYKNQLTAFQSWQLSNTSLALKALDLSDNPIDVFSVTADIFPNLTRLQIRDSLKKMKWDVHDMTYLSHISSLDISSLQSDLKDTKKILEGVSSSLTSLKMNAMKGNLQMLINVSCTIPSMSELHLQHNKLNVITSDMFHLCVNVTELDLASNNITVIQDETFRSMQHLTNLVLKYNKLRRVPVALRNLPNLSELDLSSNKIHKLSDHNFTSLTKLTKLYLSNNSIKTLPEYVFKDLKELQILKLQNNRIVQLNGAFKNDLLSLRELRLNGNQLTSIKTEEFKGLFSLYNLSLHHNNIKSLENRSFAGLLNLTELSLQSNSIDRNGLNSGAFTGLVNLTTMDLRENHIAYDDNKALKLPPFSNLSRLETLFFLSQHRRLKSQLPRNFLQGLTNLLKVSIRNMQLLSLHNDMFTYTPKLNSLDICSNDFEDLSPDLFLPIQGLKSLYISRTSLRSLDFLIKANLSQLEFMQARRNTFSIISEEVIKALEPVEYLDISLNSFTCDCNNQQFLQWAQKNNHTQVLGAYDFECNYPPNLIGKKLLELNVESCSVRIDFICYVSTTCAILLFLATSYTYHFLRWHLSYAYYYFLALLLERKNKNKQLPDQYDAFISYNTHDEPWVIGQLLPKLEGEQGWRLCLHHRDFEPGKPIVDNITDSIYGSRKTICVISRKYLESEWCSREIQVASFRLFDERKDVLVFVFLEDIPTCQLSPYYRMRSLLKRRTYLSWPRAEEHPELFWEKLRQALVPREGQGEDQLLLTVEDDRA